MENNKLSILCIENSVEYAKVVCDANPKQVEAYKAGKLATIGFLVGQIMILSKGACNPQFAKNAVQKELDNR